MRNREGRKGRRVRRGSGECEVFWEQFYTSTSISTIHPDSLATEGDNSARAGIAMKAISEDYRQIRVFQVRSRSQPKTEVERKLMAPFLKWEIIDPSPR